MKTKLYLWVMNETNTLRATHAAAAEHFLKLSFYAETPEERQEAFNKYTEHSASAARLLKTIK